MVVEKMSLAAINANSPYEVKVALADDTSGGMQKMRNRLFKYWFGIYGERKEYVFLPQTITDEEGNDNYAALIIRKDNPQFADLVSEFMATVNLLNTKPEDFDE